MGTTLYLIAQRSNATCWTLSFFPMFSQLEGVQWSGYLWVILFVSNGSMRPNCWYELSWNSEHLYTTQCNTRSCLTCPPTALFISTQLLAFCSRPCHTRADHISYDAWFVCTRCLFHLLYQICRLCQDGVYCSLWLASHFVLAHQLQTLWTSPTSGLDVQSTHPALHTQTTLQHVANLHTGIWLYRSTN